MTTKRLCPVALLLAFFLAGSLLARGRSWDFLGRAQIDANQDHGRIQIARRDLLFGTIQLRVNGDGDAIFFDRLVLHFDNGDSQEFSVGDRISSSGQNYAINLLGPRRILISVELWYYKESWSHNPRVSLYGIRLPDNDDESIVSQH